MTNAANLESSQAQGSYITGAWSHLFAGDQGERSTRIVVDSSTHRLMRMDIQANRAIMDSYRQATREEEADVEDSLVNANGDLFDTPDAYGLEYTDVLPAWVTGGFQVKQLVFYKPDPGNMGPIVLTSVGLKIEGFCAQRDLTLAYHAGDLYTAHELAAELEQLIQAPDDTLHKREKIAARIDALKAAALMAV